MARFSAKKKKNNVALGACLPPLSPFSAPLFVRSRKKRRRRSRERAERMGERSREQNLESGGGRKNRNWRNLSPRSSSYWAALPVRRDYRERVIGILGRRRRVQLPLRNGRFHGICRVERRCSSDYPHATRIPRGGTDIWPARGALRIICSFAARSLAARSIDARYATSKILANSSRRPKFNRIASRAWLTSNQPEICLFEITFTAYTRARARTCACTRGFDGTVSTINRMEEAAKRIPTGSFFHRISFLSPFFPSFSFNSTRAKLENEKGTGAIITSNCTRKLHASSERRDEKKEERNGRRKGRKRRKGVEREPSYLRADILERRGVEWGRRREKQVEEEE